MDEDGQHDPAAIGAMLDAAPAPRRRPSSTPRRPTPPRTAPSATSPAAWRTASRGSRRGRAPRLPQLPARARRGRPRARGLLRRERLPRRRPHLGRQPHGGLPGDDARGARAAVGLLEPPPRLALLAPGAHLRDAPAADGRAVRRAAQPRRARRARAGCSGRSSTDEVPVQGWTSVMVVLLVTAGATLFSLGVVAEYLGIAAKSAMGKPLYLVVSDPADGPLGRATSPPARPRSPARARPPAASCAPTGDGGPLTWVVGGGGLLGRQVVPGARRAGRRRPVVDLGPDRLAGRRQRGRGRSSGEARRFLDRAGRDRRPWRLMWCAGAGVVSTPPEALARETRLVRRFLDALGGRLSRDPGLAATRARCFFASSAGGVYAASPARPPFDEGSPTGCLAPYGHEKLAQEDLFRRFARALPGRPADRAVLQPLRPGPEPGEAAGADLPRRPGGACGASRCRSTCRSTPFATTCSPPTPAAWPSPRWSGWRTAGRIGRAGGS